MTDDRPDELTIEPWVLRLLALAVPSGLLAPWWADVLVGWAR